MQDQILEKLLNLISHFKLCLVYILQFKFNMTQQIQKEREDSSTESQNKIGPVEIPKVQTMSIQDMKQNIPNVIQQKSHRSSLPKLAFQNYDLKCLGDKNSNQFKQADFGAKNFNKRPSLTNQNNKMPPNTNQSQNFTKLMTISDLEQVRMKLQKSGDGQKLVDRNSTLKNSQQTHQTAESEFLKSNQFSGTATFLAANKVLKLNAGRNFKQKTSLLIPSSNETFSNKTYLKFEQKKNSHAQQSNVKTIPKLEFKEIPEKRRLYNKTVTDRQNKGATDDTGVFGDEFKVYQNIEPQKIERSFQSIESFNNSNLNQSPFENRNLSKFLTRHKSVLLTNQNREQARSKIISDKASRNSSSNEIRDLLPKLSLELLFQNNKLMQSVSKKSLESSEEELQKKFYQKMPISRQNQRKIQENQGQEQKLDFQSSFQNRSNSVEQQHHSKVSDRIQKQSTNLTFRNMNSKQDKEYIKSQQTQYQRDKQGTLSQTLGKNKKIFENQYANSNEHFNSSYRWNQNLSQKCLNSFKQRSSSVQKDFRRNFVKQISGLSNKQPILTSLEKETQDFSNINEKILNIYSNIKNSVTGDLKETSKTLPQNQTNVYIPVKGSETAFSREKRRNTEQRLSHLHDQDNSSQQFTQLGFSKTFIKQAQTSTFKHQLNQLQQIKGAKMLNQVTRKRNKSKEMTFLEKRALKLKQVQEDKFQAELKKQMKTISIGHEQICDKNHKKLSLSDFIDKDKQNQLDQEFYEDLMARGRLYQANKDKYFSQKLQSKRLKKYVNQESKVFSKYLQDETSDWSADDPQLKFYEQGDLLSDHSCNLDDPNYSHKNSFSQQRSLSLQRQKTKNEAILSMKDKISKKIDTQIQKLDQFERPVRKIARIFKAQPQIKQQSGIQIEQNLRQKVAQIYLTDIQKIQQSNDLQKTVGFKDFLKRSSKRFSGTKVYSKSDKFTTLNTVEDYFNDKTIAISDTQQSNLASILNQYRDYSKEQIIKNFIQKKVLVDVIDFNEFNQPRKFNELQRSNTGKKRLESYHFQEKVGQVVQKLENFELRKLMDNAAASQVLGQSAEFLFMEQVVDENEILLPLLHKISKEGELVLVDYTLSIGQCKGLAKVFEKLGQPDVRILYLENCGVDDGEFSNLLRGLSHLDQFTTLVYKKNIFLEQSFASMKHLLANSSFNSLQNLRLINCQTSNQLMNGLINFLLREHVPLKSLGLIQMSLQKREIDLIATYMQQSEDLQSLDLSWNGLLPYHLSDFWTKVAENRNLVSLNLSWNVLVDKKDQLLPIDLSAFSVKDRTIQQKRQEIQTIVSGRTLKALSASKRLAICLSQFIRQNQKLQHINLTSTGLNSQVLVDLIPSLRHARSLLSFHLAGNPGINPTVINFWVERLSIKDQEPAIKIDIDLNRKDLKDENFERNFSLSQEERAIRQYKIKNLQLWITEEQAALTLIKQKEMYLQEQDIFLKTDARDMSISRILGHKQDIPGSGQWRMTTEMQKTCWVCNHSQYVALFWNEDIGKANDRSSLGIREDEKRRVIKLIKRQNDPNLFKLGNRNATVPILFSNCTNWRGVPFVPLLDFLKSTCDTIPDFKSDAEEMAEKQLNYKKTDRKNLIKRVKMYNLRKIIEQELQKTFEDELLAARIRILEHRLGFDRQNLLNVEKSTDLRKTFILPIFIPPGRTHFILRTPQDGSTNNQSLESSRDSHKHYAIDDVDSDSSSAKLQQKFRFYYNRHIIKVREEPLLPFVKKLKYTYESHQFIKEASVFADWRHDDLKGIELAMKHDTKWWKVQKLVKDELDYTGCLNMITRYFTPLKGLHMAACADSGELHGLSRLDFINFCRKARINDQRVSMGIIDNFFTATNYEETEQEGNDDNLLIRFEFFEILIRIADAKYFQTGQCSTFTSSLEKLIQEHIVGVMGRYSPWQDFRDQHLWTFEVNDILEANLKGLKRLYDMILGTKRYAQVWTRDIHPSKKMVNVDQITHILIDEGQIEGISKRSIRQSLMLSKMTVQDENSRGDLEYVSLKFVEFLEFLCRLAYSKYENTSHHKEWKLHSKVSKILDLLLPLANQTRQVPNYSHEPVSESDDDY